MTNLEKRLLSLEAKAGPEGRDFEAEREVRQEILRHPRLTYLLQEMEVRDSKTHKKVADAARLRELKIEFNERLSEMNLSERARELDLRFKIEPEKSVPQ